MYLNKTIIIETTKRIILITVTTYYKMDLLETLLKPFAILIIIIVSFILLRSNKNNQNKSYKKPDWNYFIKNLISYYYIYKFKKSFKSHWLKNGLTLEKPKILLSEEEFDSVSFYGTDTDGNFLVVKIKKRGLKISEVWLQLILKNGDVYQLPDHPNTFVSSKDNTEWCAHGIKFIILEPFKRMRIVFNGLLRKYIQNEYDTNNNDIIHVKFYFIWTSCAAPIHWPFDHSTQLLSKCISLETWRDGSWLEMLTNSSINGYDQYGTLYGQVILPNQTIELNLPGLRSRRTGTLKHTRRFIEMLGVCQNGTLFHLGAISYYKSLSNLKYGTVRTINGNCQPLDENDIALEYLGEVVEGIPEIFTVNIKLSNKNIRNIFYLKKQKSRKLYGGNPWNFEYNIIPFHCSIKKEFGLGLAIFGYKYNGPCNVPLLIPHNFLTFNDIRKDECEKLIVKFDEKYCQSLNLVGNKAGSLSLMFGLNSTEFIVPNGFCLTTTCLEQHINEHSEILTLISKLENTTLKELAQMETACKKIEELLTSIPISNDIKILVKKHVEELQNNSEISYYNATTVQFAVRSSGLCEDTEEYSGAGQNKTILGCSTVDDIFDAIKLCWGSLFSFQSVTYRKQHGLQINCGMGVVIQIMVPAESAGVLFTCHPTTENPEEILITANYGLGESIVSGAVEPDTFIVKRTWKNDLSIKFKNLGDKSYYITSSGSTIRNENTSSEQLAQFCLTDRQILDIAAIGVRLEEFFGHNCDIEWAVYKNQVYILQSRAITTLSAFTEFELTHEFDSAILTNDEVLAFSNTGEVTPNAMSTLTVSILPPLWEKAIQEDRFNYESDLSYYHFAHVPVFSQRLALNLMNIAFDIVRDENSVTNQISNLAVFGVTKFDKKIYELANKRYEPNYLNQMYLIWDMIKTFWTIHSNKLMAEKITNRFRLDLEIEMYNKSKDLLVLLQRYHFVLLDIARLHTSASKASVSYKIITMSVLLESSKEITNDHLADITTLLSSSNEALSAEIPQKLNALSNIIIRSGKAEDFQNVPSEKLFDWLKNNIPEAARELEEILVEHGHRGIMEFDLAWDPWILDPTPLLKALQTSTKLNKLNCNDNKEKESDVYTVIGKLKTPKQRFTKYLLRYLLLKIRVGVNIREITKSTFVLIVHRFRLGYRRLGYLLEKEGRLPDASLINCLSITEIEQLVNENAIGLIQKAIKRQKLYPRLNNYKYNEFNFGRPIPVNTEVIPETVNLNETSFICGTTVYPGVIKGRACVITSVLDGHLIETNDILITEATDIGWSPYFPMLSGIVTELGGLISHGAVIAREYGIPCIVGAKNATKLFSTGDRVILDASTGKIILCRDPDQVTNTEKNMNE